MNNSANLTIVAGPCSTGKSLFTFCLGKLVDCFDPVAVDTEKLEQQIAYTSRSDILVLNDASEATLSAWSRSRGILDGKPVKARRYY